MFLIWVYTAYHIYAHSLPLELKTGMRFVVTLVPLATRVVPDKTTRGRGMIWVYTVCRNKVSLSYLYLILILTTSGDLDQMVCKRNMTWVCTLGHTAFSPGLNLLCEYLNVLWIETVRIYFLFRFKCDGSWCSP